LPESILFAHIPAKATHLQILIIDKIVSPSGDLEAIVEEEIPDDFSN